MPALAERRAEMAEVDNQPVSILEAFASGLPVISTPTGDIPSMVRHGQTGLLVPPEAPLAMSRAILDTPIAMVPPGAELGCQLEQLGRELSPAWKEMRSR